MSETFESVFGNAEKVIIDKRLEQKRKIEIKENWDKLLKKILDAINRDGYFNVLLKSGTIIYNCKRLSHEVGLGHVLLKCYNDQDELIAIITAIDIEKIL